MTASNRVKFEAEIMKSICETNFIKKKCAFIIFFLIMKFDMLNTKIILLLCIINVAYEN